MTPVPPPAGGRGARIAVLGAGIMGSCLALELARLGIACTLFDQAPAPLAGASRWNEGKIHLGYLYTASPGLETARRVIPGGLRFRAIVEDLLEQPIAPWISPQDETYLFHADSVVPPDAALAYFRAVDGEISAQARPGDYLRGLAGMHSRVLSARELESLGVPPAITAGITVPERSVDTVALADALAGRVLAEPRIAFRPGHSVRSVQAADRGGWLVDAGAGPPQCFAVVVNALWQGRPLVDALVLGKADDQPHHRYRVSAFIKAPATLTHPSVVIATGPFGDVKDYGRGRFYASWYPAGLLAEGEAVAPPPTPGLDAGARQTIATGIRGGLAGLLPGVAALFDGATQLRIEGGWVYAQARGRLDQPGSSLHRRDRLGVLQRDGYFSVDTGKYSVAPLLARQLAATIAGA